MQTTFFHITRFFKTLQNTAKYCKILQTAYFQTSCSVNKRENTHLKRNSGMPITPQKRKSHLFALSHIDTEAPARTPRRMRASPGAHQTTPNHPAPAHRPNRRGHPRHSAGTEPPGALQLAAPGHQGTAPAITAGIRISDGVWCCKTPALQMWTAMQSSRWTTSRHDAYHHHMLAPISERNHYRIMPLRRG